MKIVRENFKLHTCLFDVNTFALRANQDPIECLFKLVLRPQGTTTDLDTTRSELNKLKGNRSSLSSRTLSIVE